MIGFTGSGVPAEPEELHALFIPRNPGKCPPILITEAVSKDRLSARVAWAPGQSVSGHVQISRGQGASVQVKPTRSLGRTLPLPPPESPLPRSPTSVS